MLQPGISSRPFSRMSEENIRRWQQGVAADPGITPDADEQISVRAAGVVERRRVAIRTSQRVPAVCHSVRPVGTARINVLPVISRNRSDLALIAGDPTTNDSSPSTIRAAIHPAVRSAAARVAGAQCRRPRRWRRTARTAGAHMRVRVGHVTGIINSSGPTVESTIIRTNQPSERSRRVEGERGN